MTKSAELLGLTISQAGALLRSRTLAPDDLLRACTEQIDSLNGDLHAFLHRRDAEAAATASAAASAFVRGTAESALTGIPLAHKDMFYRAGQRVTFGAHPRRALVPAFTATVTARLDALLALDLGGLNMSEYAAGPTGLNAHYGRCANPWGVDRLSGGSSSGSAAAVAARMVFGSLGSDTGGSIRVPAALCGVTGLKPTFGRVSRHGAMPRVWSQDCVGPIARCADDCAALLAAIAGPDGLDPLVVSGAPDLGPPGHVPLDVPRIGLLETPEDVDRDVERCIDAALEDMRRLGYRIDAVRWNGVADVLDLADLIHKVEATAVHDVYLRERPEEYESFVRERFEDGLAISAVRYVQAQSLRQHLARDFVQSLLRTRDVLVLPTVGCVAPRAANIGDGTESGRHITRKLTRLTRPFSYLGLPALSVPCGFGDGGMPVGLQLVGRPFSEGLLLAIGSAYQAATEWHRASPPTASAQMM